MNTTGIIGAGNQSASSGMSLKKFIMNILCSVWLNVASWVAILVMTIVISVPVSSNGYFFLMALSAAFPALGVAAAIGGIRDKYRFKVGLGPVRQFLGSRSDLSIAWVCSMVAFTTCLISSHWFPVGSQADSTFVYRIDGKTVPVDTSFVRVKPMVSTYEWIKRDRSVSFGSNTVTTSDKVNVTGYISAKLRLHDDSSNWKWDDDATATATQKELEECFRAFVAERKASELTNTLLIEVGTGTKARLKKLGVQWNGTLKISDIHATFSGDGS